MIDGKVDTVLSRGTVVIEGDEYVGRKGHGQYLKRGLCAVPDLRAKRASEVTMRRINHWIGGQAVAGTSGRTGPVWNPATGEQQAEVDFASVEEVDAAVGRRQGGLPGVAGDVAVAPQRGDVPLPRAGRRQPQGDRAAAHVRARQGARRRPGRGGPRPREHRVRLRHPPPAEGRLQRAGLDRRRRVLDPPAARRRRRHHAVQLPGHGADVDVRQRHRLRQHVRPEAVREGPVGVAVPGRAAASRPGCPTACSTSCRATRWPSTASSSTPTSPR